MDAFLDAHGHEVFVDEPIDTVPSEVVLSTERALFEKGDLRADRRLQVSAHHEDGAFRLAGEQFLRLHLVARIYGMIAVAHVLVDLRIGRHGHAVRGGEETIPGIVIERGAMPDDDRFSLHAVDVGKPLHGKRKVRGPPLQADLTNPLSHRHLRHFVRVHAKPPVRTRFSGRVVGLVAFRRRLADPKEARRGVLEE